MGGINTSQLALETLSASSTYAMETFSRDFIWSGCAYKPLKINSEPLIAVKLSLCAGEVITLTHTLNTVVKGLFGGVFDAVLNFSTTQYADFLLQSPDYQSLSRRPRFTT